MCKVSVSSSPQHIMRSSSNTNAPHGCGSKLQPWVLDAPGAGRQINVSLLHFGLQQREGAGNQPNCQQFGYIVDKAAQKNVSICVNDGERNASIYTSTSGVIEIVTNAFLRQDESSENPTFLIRFVGK